MKVYYSPAYNGFVYTGLAEGDILFDSVVCNTKSLVSLIELHAGMNIPVASAVDRMMDYYRAMKSYVSANPGNIFEKSYERDGINSAKECLKWRDLMIVAGWKPGENDVTARMKALAEIEKNFRSISDGEKLLLVTEAVKKGCPLPENLEIVTPFDYSCFMPAEKGLLDALAERKVNVHANKDLPTKQNDLRKLSELLLENNPEKMTFTEPKDSRSVNIWQFEERSEALQYLTQIEPSEYSVWINRDNRAFDNHLACLQKPTCGSEDSGATQLSELPLIGLAIFSRPLDLKAVLNWLAVPMSPLSGNLRYSLTNAIVSTGGYFNEECKNILDGAEEKDKNAILHFLPKFSEPTECISAESKIAKSDVSDYVSELSKWISKKISICSKSDSADSDEEMSVVEQLQCALSVCSMMMRILDDLDLTKISYEDLLLTFDSLSVEAQTTASLGLKGCQNMVPSGSNFAAVSKKTIWCDFYNPDEQELTYSFLLPAEKAAVGENVWSEKDERLYDRMNKFLPFLFTEDQIDLVTVKKTGTKDAVKDPLIICLEKNIAETEIYETKSLDALDGIEKETLEKFSNRGQDAAGTIHFSRTDLVKFREQESYSSISELIDDPFDYVFEKNLYLRKQGLSALSSIPATKGTVAHAIIEELFNPKHGGTVADIEKQIEERFEEVFAQVVLENGGILLQTENLSELDIFKTQVKDCVKNLNKVIADNNLKVVGCEQPHKDVRIPEFSGVEISFRGDLDMVLEDANGDYVVFDFKYSPKFDKYKNLLKSNRSMQLALYKGLIRETAEKRARAAAYVLLPKVFVITTDNFAGDVFRVNVDEALAGNLLEKMSNSYKYRKEQIMEGVVEDGEGLAFDEDACPPIAYIDDAEREHLVPLELEKIPKEKRWKKKGNEYSDYLIFKAGK